MEGSGRRTPVRLGSESRTWGEGENLFLAWRPKRRIHHLIQGKRFEDEHLVFLVDRQRVLVRRMLSGPLFVVMIVVMMGNEIVSQQQSEGKEKERPEEKRLHLSHRS